MLRSNCKKVKEALRKYIMDNYSADGYDEDTEVAQAKTFEEVSRVILLDVKRIYDRDVERRSIQGWQDAFVEWVHILPGLLDLGIISGSESAVTILGDMLEETEEERNRYSEDDATTMLCRLMYREISSVAWEVLK